MALFKRKSPHVGAGVKPATLDAAKALHKRQTSAPAYANGGVSPAGAPPAAAGTTLTPSQVRRAQRRNGLRSS